MICKKIELPVQYKNSGIRNNGFTPYLKTYILENFDEFSKDRKRPLVLICPGGGYQMHSEREGEAVAIKMNAMGYHACLLYYSLKPMDFPAALLDLAEAMHCIRSHAEEWNVMENKIVVGGFSAGGHLAASLGVYWNSPLLKKFLPYSPEGLKPNGLLLGYPVITTGEFAHQDSIDNVLGGTKDYSESDVALDKHVSPSLPPVFIWHTDEDDFVPMENSFAFASACRKNKVPLEFHVFRRGVHGLSLATKETSWADGGGVQPECSVWPELFNSWMQTL